MSTYEIFVFGSNLQGKHGKGAALHALLHCGAKRGVAEGFQGLSYAIPTKRTPYETLPLHEIEKYVKRFIARARHTPQFTYKVTAIGCGYAGYLPRDIAPMFREALELPHIQLPPEFILELSR